MFLSVYGNEISKAQFLRDYEMCYFYRNGASCDEQIMRLFGKRLDENDVAEILHWKTGNVIKIEGKRKFVNTRRGKIFADDILEILKKVSLEEIKENNYAKDTFQELCNIENMGEVYAAAFLYFVSGGYYPIYDRFARMALTALEDDNIKIGDSVRFKSLSWNSYLTYIDELTRNFGDNWRTNIEENRRIDRALWAYGHMFKEN